MILVPAAELILKVTKLKHHPHVKARLPLRTRIGVYAFVTGLDMILAMVYLPTQVEKAMVARAK